MPFVCFRSAWSNGALLASADVTRLLTPGAGFATFELPIPGNPTLVGVALHTQMLQLELGALGNPVALSASNALRATIGTY